MSKDLAEHAVIEAHAKELYGKLLGGLNPAEVRKLLSSNSRAQTCAGVADFCMEAAGMWQAAAKAAQQKVEEDLAAKAKQETEEALLA